MHGWTESECVTHVPDRTSNKHHAQKINTSNSKAATTNVGTMLDRWTRSNMSGYSILFYSCILVLQTTVRLLASVWTNDADTMTVCTDVRYSTQVIHHVVSHEESYKS